MAKVLSDAELTAVVEELTKPKAVLASAVDPMKLFCENWPKAKAILKWFASSGNTWVKLAVSVALTIGNRLYVDKCKV